VNKIILIGHVGKDPEVRYYDNGGSVANFSLATTERGYKTANGTQIPDRTEWHNIVLWRGLAEIAEKYIHKGSKIFIEGKIRTRSYDDQQGIKRYVTEIWGDNLELLDRKPDNNQSYPSQTSGAQSSVAEDAVQQTPQKDAKTSTPDPLETEEDDLPF
ncbi:MAG: single-stranded DNA-binding protein, partial [Dysgonamonadaceae bacterium]|nr:single-stranded DNA-binding protein [Dysgonamonadaceae bacterium]